jgi:hypothetical protein
MISNLLILNSSGTFSRDLWWVEDPEATAGYNIYRAADYPMMPTDPAYINPTNWIKLNATPVEGHFYRDMSTLQEVTYTLQPSDWTEQGEMGRWVFRIPDIPYATVLAGRHVVSNSPDDVTVIMSASGDFGVDKVSMRPAQVSGLDRTVWLRMGNTLPVGGAVSDIPLASNGLVYAADYSGIAAFQVVYNKALNFVDIGNGMDRYYYCVIPLNDKGEIHPPGARGSEIRNTKEIENLSWEFAEMVRRNAFLFDQGGEPAYLMFRKWQGRSCGCLYGSREPKTGCPSCFETGFIGGYIGPYDFTFVPPDSALVRESMEGGIKTTRESRSFLGPTPIVQDGDLIVRRSANERLVISGVTYKTSRGVILQQDFNVQLLSRGDTRYLIPLNSGLPTIFNPIVRPNPVNGQNGPNGTGSGEPIADPRTIPGNTNENPNIPIGRTVQFGKIMR